MELEAPDAAVDLRDAKNVELSRQICLDVLDGMDIDTAVHAARRSDAQLREIVQTALAMAQNLRSLVPALSTASLQQWPPSRPVMEGMRILSREYKSRNGAHVAFVVALSGHCRLAHERRLGAAMDPTGSKRAYSWLRWVAYRAGCFYDRGVKWFVVYTPDKSVAIILKFIYVFMHETPLASMGDRTRDSPVMMVSYKHVTHASCVEDWLSAQRALTENMHDLAGWGSFDCLDNDAFCLLHNVLETNSRQLAPVWRATFQQECNGDPLSFLVALPPNHVLRTRFCNPRTTRCSECKKLNVESGCSRCYNSFQCSQACAKRHRARDTRCRPPDGEAWL